MKQFKRIALILVLLASLLLTGCGPVRQYTDADGPMRVALIVDTAGINDKSFNQQTYEACEEFCAEYGIPFTYFEPDKSNRFSFRNIMDAAVASGYNVLIVTGSQYAARVGEMSRKYPDVKFIGMDMNDDTVVSALVGSSYTGDPADYDLEEYLRADNTYLLTFREDIAGYLAGYAAVRLGYESLGYIGGVEIPAVMRYGYGYLQGIRDAAEEMGKTDRILVRYAYAGQFTAAAEITAAMETWYQSGTEIVFSCGGGIYSSVAEACAKNDGRIIGVDLDQKEQMDAYKDGITVTSALKDMKAAVRFALKKIYDGEWNDLSGKRDRLGLASSEDVTLNYVGLPLETTQWSDGFGPEEFTELVRKILEGELTVESDTAKMPDFSFRLEKREGTIV